MCHSSLCVSGNSASAPPSSSSDDSSSTQYTKLLLSVFVLVSGSFLAIACSSGKLTASSFVYWGFGLGCGLGVGGLCMLFASYRLMGFFSDLKSDCRGLGYQLIVFVVGLGIFSVVWFALGWPAEMVFSLFSGLYTFSGLPAIAVSFTQGVIRLLPAILFFISMIWLWVSSNRGEEGSMF